MQATTTMIDGVEYSISETESQTILKSLHKDEFGFHCTMRFTKNKAESDLAKENLYDLFAREIV
ncbi:hypothetical protein AF332_12080 [Sporosarcina globispora]|uniref:Uncharacterized protein n=1 Tax=Sporosarcina globispora TaxID=1459 RepID=A0A0M0GCN1_SPOGL|nr:hypothetical protein [Sporosarcina globispora]KON87493.1 hypothetical protein AF332_12080 [Sporosarcina globispora]